MGLWCKDLPFVTVARSRVPKRVTFVYPHYENFTFLRHRQLAQWNAYPEHLRAHTSAVIVDDCSPGHRSISDAFNMEPEPFPIKLFRIDVDVRWNWLAARNRGAKESPNGWLLMTDMDHMVPVETLEACIYGVHRTDTIYGFSRVEHTGKAIEPHKNSWFITKEMFWRVGGYDERCSGFYGSDGLWRRRCAATAPMAILLDTLVRYEFVGDSSTTRYQRKEAQDAQLQKLVASFPKGSKPTTLSYPYHEIRMNETEVA